MAVHVEHAVLHASELALVVLTAIGQPAGVVIVEAVLIVGGEAALTLAGATAATNFQVHGIFFAKIVILDVASAIASPNTEFFDLVGCGITSELIVGHAEIQVSALNHREDTIRHIN